MDSDGYSIPHFNARHKPIKAQDHSVFPEEVYYKDDEVSDGQQSESENQSFSNMSESLSASELNQQWGIVQKNQYTSYDLQKSFSNIRLSTQLNQVNNSDQIQFNLITQQLINTFQLYNIFSDQIEPQNDLSVQQFKKGEVVNSTSSVGSADFDTLDQLTPYGFHDSRNYISKAFESKTLKQRRNKNSAIAGQGCHKNSKDRSSVTNFYADTGNQFMKLLLQLDETALGQTLEKTIHCYKGDDQKLNAEISNKKGYQVSINKKWHLFLLYGDNQSREFYLTFLERDCETYIRQSKMKDIESNLETLKSWQGKAKNYQQNQKMASEMFAQMLKSRKYIKKVQSEKKSMKNMKEGSKRFQSLKAKIAE